MEGRHTDEGRFRVATCFFKFLGLLGGGVLRPPAVPSACGRLWC